MSNAVFGTINAPPGTLNQATQNGTANTLAMYTATGGLTATGVIVGSNLSGTNSGDVTLGTASGLSLTGQALSLAVASASLTGALSNVDWATFNNKQAALTFASSLVNTSGTVTLVNDAATPGLNRYYGTDGSGAKGFYTAAGLGTGTVTSVAAAGDSGGILSWTGSPITTAGTLTPVFNTITAGAANVFAAPLSGPGKPIFRPLANIDLGAITLSGDVNSTGITTTVITVGGQTAANVAAATVLANAATNVNTYSTIVKRDATGSFNSSRSLQVFTAGTFAHTATVAESGTEFMLRGTSATDALTVTLASNPASNANVYYGAQIDSYGAAIYMSSPGTGSIFFGGGAYSSHYIYSNSPNSTVTLTGIPGTDSYMVTAMTGTWNNSVNTNVYIDGVYADPGTINVVTATRGPSTLVQRDGAGQASLGVYSTMSRPAQNGATQYLPVNGSSGNWCFLSTGTSGGSINWTMPATSAWLGPIRFSIGNGASNGSVSLLASSGMTIYGPTSSGTTLANSTHGLVVMMNVFWFEPASVLVESFTGTWTLS
jgi:hypothetical protein